MSMESASEEGIAKQSKTAAFSDAGETNNSKQKIAEKKGTVR